MKTKPIIVGIAGGTGAGKTVLAHAIADRMNSQDVVIIQYDSYYKDRSHLPLSERAKANYDHPDALDIDLLIQHLKELIAGNTVDIPVYDFSTHCQSNKRIQIDPVKVVILEGILLLADARVRQLMDVKIFVDANDDVRFIRRLQRDIKERQRTMESIINQYLETVRPMHMQFVEPSRRYADIVVLDVKNNVVVEAIAGVVKAMMESM